MRKALFSHGKLWKSKLIRFNKDDKSNSIEPTKNYTFFNHIQIQLINITKWTITILDPTSLYLLPKIINYSQNVHVETRNVQLFAFFFFCYFSKLFSCSILTESLFILWLEIKGPWKFEINVISLFLIEFADI